MLVQVVMPAQVPEVASAAYDLLALAMWPDPARIRAALERYATEHDLRVWAWMKGGRPVCAAGLRVIDSQAELLHIGTRPDSRGQGYGRSLLLALLDRLELKTLEAETDEASVGFYHRSGFVVEETVTRGGTIRYRCTRTA